MSTPPLSAHDLRAAAEAHRELGPEYSDAVIDSFLEKLQTRLDERVNARLAELSVPRRIPLLMLSADRLRNLLPRVAVGIGGLGVPLSLMLYNAAPYFMGHVRDLWAVSLIASAATCGAGLARISRGRR